MKNKFNPLTSFLRGFGNILRVGGKTPFPRRKSTNDRINIASDWQTIEQDIKRALETIQTNKIR